MQFPDDSVVGEKLIVLSLDSENNLFLFNLNRWSRSANTLDHLPGSMVQMTQPQPRRFTLCDRLPESLLLLLATPIALVAAGFAGSSIARGHEGDWCGK